MKWILLCFTGFACGTAIAGGVISFFIMIGLVPRLIQRTHTGRYILMYESIITIGGICGGLSLLYDGRIPIGWIGDILTGFFSGIYVGCLALALTEVLNTLPILCRRTGISRNLKWIVLALILGKTAGSVIYYFVPGFLKIN